MIVLPITEVKTHKEFFDFEAKYEGKSEEITPAMISEDMAKRSGLPPEKFIKILTAAELSRIDFIYDEQKSAPFMLEINTVPGQSEASIVPRQVKAYGWTLKEFYSSLIEDALNRKS